MNFHLHRSLFFFRATNVNVFGLEIFKPFMNSVWISLGIIIILFSMVLHLSLTRERGAPKSIPIVLLLCFGIFCQQGITYRIRKNSTRWSIIFLFFASYIIYNFYTSTLVSTLVETKPISSIENKEELADSNIPIGFCKSELIKNFIKVNSFSPKHHLI